MKLLPALTTTLAATALFAWAAGSPAVTYVGHDKVTAALAKSAPLVSASDLLVSGSHRDKGGNVEIHDKETDVLYVIDGSATFITGGTAVGEKVTKAGQRTATDIQGGETHHLTKGDVIVVPAGVPHWFKEVPQNVSYFVVKVLKP